MGSLVIVWLFIFSFRSTAVGSCGVLDCEGLLLQSKILKYRYLHQRHKLAPYTVAWVPPQGLNCASIDAHGLQTIILCEIMKCSCLKKYQLGAHPMNYRNSEWKISPLILVKAKSSSVSLYV